MYFTFTFINLADAFDKKWQGPGQEAVLHAV